MASSALSARESVRIGCSQLHRAVWADLKFLFYNLFLQIIVRSLFLLSHPVILAATCPGEMWNCIGHYNFLPFL